MRTVARCRRFLISILNAAMKPFLVLAVVLLSVPLASLGDVVTVRDTVEKFVNIRVAPTADSEVIGKLHRGDQVEFVASVPRWHEVTVADGRNGFVSRVWTKVVVGLVALANAPGPAPQEAEAVLDPVADNEVTASALAATAADPSSPADDPKVANQAGGERATPSEALEPSEPVVVNESPEDLVQEQSPETTVAKATPIPVVQPQPVEPPMAEQHPAPVALADIGGTPNYLAKFTGPTKAGNSRIIDDGINVGIGTAAPQQALDVNGNVQIHNQSSNLVVLSLSQQAGGTGYITHNLAGTLTIGAGSEDRLTIGRDGNLGVGTNRPRYPLEMANGAYVSAGGVWTNASSRDLKENIAELALEEALTALRGLMPVQFNYKLDADDHHLGFIAEDVPDLVATIDRRGLSSMDIVAVLTTVVQAQQRRLDELEARLGQE